MRQDVRVLDACASDMFFRVPSENRTCASSSVGRIVASALDAACVDADDYHSSEAVGESHARNCT